MLAYFYYSTVGCSIATYGLFLLNDTTGKINNKVIAKLCLYYRWQSDIFAIFA